MISFFKTTLKFLICCVILMVFSISSVQGQDIPDKKLEKPQKLVNDKEYYKAVRAYKDLLKEFPENDSIIVALARTYSQIPDHDNSLYWITRIIERDRQNTSPDIIYFYIEELQRAGKYEIAQIWLDKIKLELMSDSMDFSAVSYENLFKDTTFIQIQNQQVNTESADFSPVRYKDGILFYSNRNRTGKKQIKIGTDVEADIIFCNIDSTYQLYGPQIFNQLIGYGYYEGTFDFFNNYSEMIVSKFMATEQNIIKDENKISGLKLFHSKVDTVKNELFTLDPLPFNIHGFSVAHPSISSDGKTLFFSSNIPGGFGGADLYISRKVNSEWSSPENLGVSFNSPFDEYFPYLYNGTVFFSSNRPEGIGGMDIYKQRIDNINREVKPKNLGAPFNSPADDINLITLDNGVNGYFVSNRAGGKGNEDLYSFRIKSISVSELIREILEENSLEGLKISYIQTPQIGVRKQNEEFNATETSTIDQSISNNSQPSASRSQPVEIQIMPVNIDEGVDIPNDEKLDGNYSQRLKIIILKDGNIIEELQAPDPINVATFFDVKAELKNLIDKIPVEEPVDTYLELVRQRDDIVYRVQIAASLEPLSEQQLNNIYKGSESVNSFFEEGWHKYYIREFKNYFEAEKLKKTCGVKDAFIVAYKGEEKQVLMEAIKEQYETKSFVDNIDGDIIDSVRLNYQFNEISFLFNQNSQVKSILQKLLDNDHYRLVIQAHTDKYGSITYNLGLSAERAQHAAEFFKTKGISPRRISIRFYGEERLLEDCEDKIKCREEIQLLNRRIELLLIE